MTGLAFYGSPMANQTLITGLGGSRTVGPGVAPIRDFAVLDAISAGIAGVAILIVNLTVVSEPGVYLVPVVMAVLVGALLVARRMVLAGHVIASLALIAASNWATTIVVVGLLPWLLPVMVLTVLMPLVLAIPHLDARALSWFLVGAVATLVAIGLLGIGRDDGGVVDDIADEWELVVIVAGLAGHAAPIGLIVWQANRQHREATEDALDLAAQLSDSRRRLVEAADAERTRIERNLHDGAQQRLISVAMALRLRGDDSLQPLIGEIEGAMDDIRELSHGISPPLLELSGLPAALAAAARRHGSIELDLADVGRHDRGIENAFYFCGLEALQNAAKHAPNSAVSVSLAVVDDRLRLVVSDDGPGFDPTSAAPDSRGMTNMADRLGSIGGDLLISSAPGAGTTITAEVSC